MLRDWLKGARKYYISACLILAGATGVSRAGDNDTTDLRQLIEQQNKVIQELKQRLDSATTPIAAPGDQPAQLDESSVRKIVGDYLGEQAQKKDAAKKQADADGYGVGEDLSMGVRWNPLIGRGLEFSTPAKDFIIHIGGRYYEDFVSFSQSDLSNIKNYKGNGGLINAPNSFGTGQYDDGTLFRRLRLTVDGQLYENWEFFTEYQFEQVTPHGIVNLDEFWLGIKNLPIVQNVRVGNVKEQQGFESLSSSRVITFLERSPLFDTFDTEFGDGIWMFQNYFDQHMTVHEQLLRKGSGDDGLQLGNGLWQYIARVTILPLWEDQGRTMLHLGLSYKNAMRTFALNDAPLDPQSDFQDNAIGYATRVSQRDAIGTTSAFSNNVVNFPAAGGGGTQALGGPLGKGVGINNGISTTGTDGNGTSVVNTGILNAEGYNQFGGELFFVRGPLSIQAEYIGSLLYDYRAPVPTFATAGVPSINTATQYKPSANPYFWGYYVQAGYFLTGENRYYDRRTGRAPGTYASRILTPFWGVRDENGNWDFGRGAWEVAARFAHVQLDSENVLGGNLNEITLGLNWFPIQNVKIQFQYLHDERDGLFPVTFAGSGLAATAQPIVGDRGFSSTVNGFGVRFGLDY